MTIKPIKIDIEDIKDKRLYAQIAFLVDRSDFLKEIQSIRKEYRIDPSLQRDDYLRTASDESLSALPKISARLLNRVAEIRHSFHCPPYSDDAIIQAILFHKIKSIKATQVILHRKSNDSNIHTYSGSHFEMAILLTPLSTKKEVIAAFEESKKLRSMYKSNHRLALPFSKKTLNNFVRDRDWYWQVKEDGNYQSLIEDWNERPDVHEFKVFHKGSQRCDMCYIDDDNYVHTAVSEYRKNLTNHPPEV